MQTRFIPALLMVLAAVALVGCTDDSTSEVTASQQEVVDKWSEAFLDGNPNAVAALFTEDGIYEERGPYQVFEGHPAIQTQLEEGFLYADANEMTADSVIAGDAVLWGEDDVIVVEWTIAGMSAPGTRDPDNKTPFSVEAVTMFEMEDDLIARSVFYAPWDDLFN